MQFGLFDLPWWGNVLMTLGLTHITIVAVTIFLHRHQAHHALELHPGVSHFFRFWLWLTTGMIAKQWVAIHRKHHAKTDTADDPHSPQFYGIGKVLFEGTELYRAESRNDVTMATFSHGTPDDWIERKLYTPHSRLGIGLMVVIDIALFGPIGIAIWAVQMLWIPLFAAGVINGIGHYWGYRNFATDDSSTNIVPWGILIGGEELHNNHHAYVTSARLSNKWWEFDIGWMYIHILALLGLATVRELVPSIRYNPAKTRCDEGTLQAVITHRYDVQARFAKSLRQAASEEVRRLHASAFPELKYATVRDAVRHWLQRDTPALPDTERAVLEQALRFSSVLRTIDSMRHDLTALWSRSSATKEQLLAQLETWCQYAEASDIGALRTFSRTLRCYDSPL